MRWRASWRLDVAFSRGSLMLVSWFASYGAAGMGIWHVAFARPPSDVMCKHILRRAWLKSSRGLQLQTLQSGCQWLPAPLEGGR